MNSCSLFASGEKLSRRCSDTLGAYLLHQVVYLLGYRKQTLLLVPFSDELHRDWYSIIDFGLVVGLDNCILLVVWGEYGSLLIHVLVNERDGENAGWGVYGRFC